MPGSDGGKEEENKPSRAWSMPRMQSVTVQVEQEKEEVKRSVRNLHRSKTHFLSARMSGSDEKIDGMSLRRREQMLEKFAKSVANACLVCDDYTVRIKPGLFDEDDLLEMDETLEAFRHKEKAADEAGGEPVEVSGDAEGSHIPDLPKDAIIPKLNICIIIVGTRGDVQPFMAIGQRLQKVYGHRVRLATHANFRIFVQDAGLEFYPLGGDPKVLAEYMVKNKGFLPSSTTDIHTQRRELKAIIHSVYPACTEPDPEGRGTPFRADAIIANPPTMAHTTVAEALQVPLHIFFTMPWTPTHEYPHPLARVVQYTGYENKLSYYVVDTILWAGNRDIINDLRRKLGLRVHRMRHSPINRIPYGYIWSPSLVPKPKDWGSEIDVVGFCFLDLASQYSPPEDLVKWLEAGPPPVFIGFGSLPVMDPKGMTATIVEALQETGQRGIIQKGWGGLGEVDNPPDSVYILGNCPHDWLFPRCVAAIHHGGAGTTAASLAASCPTTVSPFFGDQPFWGSRVASAGVGPDPIPSAPFTKDRLVEAIKFMLQDEVKQAAKELALKLANENGVIGAVNAFHKHLPRGFAARQKSTPWLISEMSASVTKSASISGLLPSPALLSCCTSPTTAS